MRAINYANQVASFTPLQPYQMVRVALVEGMKPGYIVPDRVKYLRLLKEHLDIDERHLDALWDILQEPRPTDRQKEYLEFIIGQVAYDSKLWKSFRTSEYERFKEEGVVIEHDGQNLQDLVSRMVAMGENKVIFVPTIADIQSGDEVDYRKHVQTHNTFYLNGIHSVRAFAERKELVLPDDYTGSFPMRQDVWDILLSKGNPSNTFYFTEALHSTVDAIKNPSMKETVVARIAHKKRDGTNVVWNSHDDVEASEVYSYFLEYDMGILQELGDLIKKEEDKPPGDRYYGTNVFKVPKRTPIIKEDGKIEKHDIVVFHFWPDIEGKRRPLSWMLTDPLCLDPGSIDRSNYEEWTSEQMGRFVPQHDLHSMMISLARIRALEISLESAVNNFSPVPTPEYSREVDKFRYNIAYEIPREGRVPERKYVGEVGIEILIHELWKLKEWTFERMFNPRGRVGRQLLKPMYI